MAGGSFGALDHWWDLCCTCGTGFVGGGVGGTALPLTAEAAPHGGWGALGVGFQAWRRGRSQIDLRCGQSKSLCVRHVIDMKSANFYDSSRMKLILCARTVEEHSNRLLEYLVCCLRYQTSLSGLGPRLVRTTVEFRVRVGDIDLSEVISGWSSSRGPSVADLSSTRKRRLEGEYERELVRE